MAKEAKCTNCERWFEVVPVHKLEGKRQLPSKRPRRWVWRYGKDGHCPGCLAEEPHFNKDKRERRDVDPMTGEVLK